MHTLLSHRLQLAKSQQPCLVVSEEDGVGYDCNTACVGSSSWPIVNMLTFWPITTDQRKRWGCIRRPRKNSPRSRFPMVVCALPCRFDSCAEQTDWLSWSRAFGLAMWRAINRASTCKGPECESRHFDHPFPTCSDSLDVLLTRTTLSQANMVAGRYQTRSHKTDRAPLARRGHGQ